jgi:hypothetical protein
MGNIMTTNKQNKRIIGITAVTVISALTLAGCGGGSGGGSGESSSETFGFLSLGISDGPIHGAEKVCVTFTDIELKPADGPSTLISLSAPETINLLEFQGANAMPILTSEQLPAGHYNWMRLGVNAVRGSNGGIGDTGGETCDGEASYIVMDDGSVSNLYVPSGENSGLKLHGGYTVPANDTVTLTAEFDLGKSITAPPGQAPDVKLRPTIKLVNNNEVGTLTGQVANEFAEAESCEPSVYVFNDGVTPNGIVDEVDDEFDPVATAIVEPQDQEDSSVQWHYSIGFLLTGDYEAAFTCDGEAFEPADGKPAMIVVGEVTTVDFDAPAP